MKMLIKKRYVFLLLLLLLPLTFAFSGQQNYLPARVLSVSDGDTIHVSLNGKNERVRMIGVNTPEIAHPELGIKEQPYGQAAKNYTSKALQGRKVFLEFDVEKRDKYGRLLAYVWLEKPFSNQETEARKKMFNAILLQNGYAQVMTIPPNVKYADFFVKLQREARNQGKGLWGIPVVNKVSSAAVNTKTYLGNSNTRKFHFPSCQWAQKISPAHRVWFNSREQAVKAGYAPCKVCKP
ncbi:micrococcal nuclease [Carboxydocella thermautotrophica]|nr:micrococcal nuclease [Carboxydocella thermautotrophica]